MKSEEDILNEIGYLSENLKTSKISYEKLFETTRELSDKAATAMHDVDTAVRELDKLSELIESGEIPLDEESRRVLSYLFAENLDIVHNFGAYRDLYGHVDEASKNMTYSLAAHERVIGKARRLLV